MRAFAGLFLALAASTAVFAEHAVLSNPTLAFTHVNVIDATGGPLQPDMTVIVRDGLIAELGNTQKIRAVVLSGRYFSRADLDQMLKGIEVAAAASK